ncbi:Dyp-type peroxidase [Methylobacterium sp. WSM2598]|uniref:Dyp-type peroxidase n=1 Tax=Methylobacterium sp. WSM2598 TaxID=398261 RepID=UPI000366D3D4|nr:Dyp-type peroxidase domain-containing protein [Methylobacterium sp. WSM2598]
MAGGAVSTRTEGEPRPNWKLADPVAKCTQGLVASGFAHLPFGRALFLEFAWDDRVQGGMWMRQLAQRVEINDGAPDEKTPCAAALAFTWTGLQRMALDARALASFSRPFREGMFQEDRLRRLGDRWRGKWCQTVIKGGPRWSGNVPLNDPTRPDHNWIGATTVPRSGPAEEDVRTPLTVHALLLLYTRTMEEAEAWSQRVRELLGEAGVVVVHELDLLLDVQKKEGFSREHFGFADALSQPIPFGLKEPTNESELVRFNGAPAPKDPVQGVPLGEILMGYQNGHSEPAPGPVVARQKEGDLSAVDTRIEKAGLPEHSLAEGFADLGINGSYLVVRELKQDVAAFWNSFHANATRLKEADPSIGNIDARWLAERAVGRSIDGHLLCPGNVTLPPDRYRMPDSSFRFSVSDPRGLGCPPGSHIRRAFPRDGLSHFSTEESHETMLQAANNHRILRRGRKYGTEIANLCEDDEADRGLLFMCLNTDIERQFEFVQQNWLLNSTFSTLFNEVDPLVGPAGPLTIPQDPLRRTVHVETYVQLVGGEYFFLPSMPALRYLSLL